MGEMPNGTSERVAKLVIGTRGSRLALWQANHVAERIRLACPELTVETEVIKTTGDKILDVALSKIGDKGLFTKELEVALADGRVDICVHSMKDVPTTLPESLEIGAMLERADVRDTLVAAPGMTLKTLPSGARVGTGALRRLAQLRALRSDLTFVDLRGNLDTRIRKVQEGELDAVILASAGIRRMGWEEHISAYLSVDEVVPAVGQGAIGLEIRSDDEHTHAVCERVTSHATMCCVGAERHIMRTLEGGCQVPIGAYARIERNVEGDTTGSVSWTGMFRIDAMVASLDGSDLIRSAIESPLGEGESIPGPEDVTALAQTVVEGLLEQGAREILHEVRMANGIDVG